MDIPQRKKKNGNFLSGKQNRNLQNYSCNKESPLTPNKLERPTNAITIKQDQERPSFLRLENKAFRRASIIERQKNWPDLVTQ